MLRNLIMSIVRLRAECRMFVQHPSSGIGIGGFSHCGGVGCQAPADSPPRGRVETGISDLTEINFLAFGGGEISLIDGSVIGLSGDLVDTGPQESAYLTPFIDV